MTPKKSYFLYASLSFFSWLHWTTSTVSDLEFAIPPQKCYTRLDFKTDACIHHPTMGTTMYKDILLSKEEKSQTSIKQMETCWGKQVSF